MNRGCQCRGEVRKMNKRIRQAMIMDGKRPEKIEQLAHDYLGKMAEEDITLDEAKSVVGIMARTIERSE